MLEQLFDPLIFIMAVVAISGAVWFAIGSTWNLKRGNDALKWLRVGLPALGEKTTLQWLGTSVVKLYIAKAKTPFKDLEILIVLEPRDVPLFWLWHHLRGRRDTLLFRGNLREPPAFEVELVNLNLWTGREGLTRLDQTAWPKVSLSGVATLSPFLAFAHGLQASDRLQDWFTRSTHLTPELARISLRRSATYHVQWHSTVPPLNAVASSEIIRLLQQIGKQASE
jgi:hypothetical protein